MVFSTLRSPFASRVACRRLRRWVLWLAVIAVWDLPAFEAAAAPSARVVRKGEAKGQRVRPRKLRKKRRRRKARKRSRVARQRAPKALYKRIKRALKYDNTARAIALLQTIRAQDAAERRSRRMLLKLYGDDEAHRDDRLAVLKELSVIQPNRLRWHQELADGYAAAGRLPEALPHLEAWQKRRPDDAGLAGRLGVAYVNAGQGESAIPLFEQAHEAEPNNADWLVPLVDLYLQAGRGKDATTALEKVIALRPDDPTLRPRLAALYTHTDQRPKAIEMYQGLIAVEPTNVALWERLAEVQQAENDTDGLIASLEKLHALEPEDPTHRERLVQQYEWNKRGAEAIPLLQEMVKQSPDDPQLRLRLAGQLAAQREIAAARDHVDVAVKKGDDSIAARFLLAQLCHWDNCWKTSERLYDEILRQDPEHDQARRYATMLRQHRGPLLRPWFEAFRDSNEVTRVTLGSEFHYALREDLALAGNYFHRVLSEPFGNVLEIANQDLITARVDYSPRPNVTLGVEAGAETFLRRLPAAPVWGAKVDTSWGGWLFPSLSYQYRTHINTITAVDEQVRVHALQGAVYAEPKPWLIASAAFTQNIFNDGNKSVDVYSQLAWRPFYKRFLLKLGATLGYQDFAIQHPTAQPYFTTDQLLIVAPGIDVGYRFGENLSTEVGYSLAMGDPAGLSHNPRVSVVWDISAFDRVRAAYYNAGSATYRSGLARIEFAHRF